jgi:hypothetical protein
VLEGGYEAVNVANGTQAVFSGLTGNEFTDPVDPSPYPEPDTDELIAQIRKHHKL